jgi:hypothetical protein
MSTLESQTGCLPPARIVTFALLVIHNGKDTPSLVYSVTNDSNVRVLYIADGDTIAIVRPMNGCIENESTEKTRHGSPELNQTIEEIDI